MSDERLISEVIIEHLARGYHNAINKHWIEHFGGDDRPWETVPDLPITGSSMENRRDILAWMTAAVEELKASGFEIVKR